MIRTSALVLAFMVVLGAVGYAQNMRGFGASNVKVPRAAAGMVNADGSVAQGSHFTVVHVGTGDYEITFNERYFVSGCPILTLTGVSTRNTYSVQPRRCNVYEVYFYGSNGRLADSTFDLIAVASE